MTTYRRSLVLAVVMSLTALIVAQDGDLITTNPLNGRSFFQAGPLVAGGPVVAPFNLTVGTGALNLATLNARGDQLPVNDADPLQAGMRCTFRTDVASAIPQSWRMYRDVNRIGAIWNENNHRVWHVQSLEQRDVAQDRYSGLMLQNESGDGMWVMNAGAPTGTRAFPLPATQVLDAVGFTAFGPRASWLPASPRPRGPWSRLHTFHDVMGANRPEFAFRPQMLNGLTLTGNSDHAYVGQWFDHGASGLGAEVDDASKLLIGISENALPPDTFHHQDDISVRFFGDIAQPDGPASTV